MTKPDLKISREKAHAGQYLRWYESKFYPKTILTSIIIPTDAADFPDVSFYQGVIDWDKMAAKTRAVILRIGQNTWPDSQFERNYTEAKKRNILVGGYWFYDGRVSPTSQANLLKSLTAGKVFEMEVFADWERNYGGGYEGLPNVVNFMKQIDGKVTCYDVGMYTGYYWFTANSNATVHAAEYEYLKSKSLWLAWYSAANVVQVPKPWTTWTHWQYGTPAVGHEYGCQTVELDMNKHNGGLEGYTVPSPPPTGGMMYYGRNKTTLTNIRTGPGLTFTDIGDLLLNDLIEADVKQKDTNGVDWWHLTKITRGSVSVALPGPNCWAWGTNIEELTPPPPVVTVTSMNITLAKGSTVKTNYSDGTSKTETA